MRGVLPACLALAAALAVPPATASQPIKNANGATQASAPAKPLPTLTPRAGCPPTGPDGRPTTSLELNGFSTQAQAEKEVFDYVSCFESVDAIIRWLKEQGFEKAYFNDRSSMRRGSVSISDVLTASRSMDGIDATAVWGGPVSRFWQWLVAYRVSIGIIFRPSMSVSSVKFGLLIE